MNAKYLCKVFSYTEINAQRLVVHNIHHCEVLCRAGELTEATYRAVQ